MAKVDVLLPVKNGVRFLSEAIDSIRQQSFTDWRLWILDHGSTDGSLEISSRYAEVDRRIKTRALPQARNLADLLNQGLAFCNGAFVMRHDADDVCYPDRIENTLLAFSRTPDAIVIAGQAEIIDEDGQHRGILRVPVGIQRISAASLFMNPIIHPTATFHRERMSRIGACYGKDFSKLRSAGNRIEVSALAEDYFLFGQLALLGKCANVEKSLIRYRRHSQAVGVARHAEQLAASLKVSRYLATLFCERHRVPKFDPAPFCSHAQQLVPCPLPDLPHAFGRMRISMERGFGKSAGLQREMDFRQVLATRGTLDMLFRYHRFAQNCSVEAAERGTVRSWVLRHLRTRAALPPALAWA